jgi:hypothetical protein
MYIDPGTGSLILQLLAAGVISAAATVSRFRTALKTAFRRLFRLKA